MTKEQLDELERLKKLLFHLFRVGYTKGHHDTVEGCYLDRTRDEYDGDLGDEVNELIHYYNSDIIALARDGLKWRELQTVGAQAHYDLSRNMTEGERIQKDIELVKILKGDA